MCHRKTVRWITRLAFVWGLLVICPIQSTNAEEGTSNQLWASFILGFHTNDRFYTEIDTQPKIQVSGGEEWRSLSLKWLGKYYPNSWIDLIAELKTAYTIQTDDLRSFELAPRVGIRFHLVEQIITKTVKSHKRLLERIPVNRFNFAALMRLEYRNFYYNEEIDSSHETRFRIRPEFKIAINNPSLGDDKTLFFRADVEFFVPISDSVPERFVNKTRFRCGFGYRMNYNFRVELLYIYDQNRDSSLEDFTADGSMFDFRLKFIF